MFDGASPFRIRSGSLAASSPIRSGRSTPSCAARFKECLGGDDNGPVCLFCDERDSRSRRIVGALPVGKHRRIDDRTPIRQGRNPLPHFGHRLADQVDHVQSASGNGNLSLPVSIDNQTIPSIADECDCLKSRHHRMCRFDRVRERQFSDGAGYAVGQLQPCAKSISSTIAKTTGTAGHNSERQLSTSSRVADPIATTTPIGMS